MNRLRLLCLLVVIAVAAVFPARADDVFIPKFLQNPPETLDDGMFIISVGGRAVATELFQYESRADSMNVASHYRQPLRNGDTLRKVTFVVVKRFDYDLKFYQSTLTLGKDKYVRGLTFADTTISIFRERDGAGDGYGYTRPPGSLFALEANSYMLFDIVCRNLAQRPFTTRAIQVISLGDQDTIITATARDRGRDTLRWGGKTLVVRKLSLSDGTTEFFMWIGPQNYMVRFEQPALGLVVERKPPPVKTASKKPAPKGASAEPVETPKPD